MATDSPAGPRFLVEVETTPRMRRIVLAVEVRGRRRELARVLQRDSVWYATEAGKAGKYRPFEAPFDFPDAYVYLTRSEPLCVNEAAIAALGTYAGTEAGVATYRAPLPELARRQLETLIADVEAPARGKAEKPANPERAKAIATMKDLLARGLETRVDLANGLIVQHGTAQRPTRVLDFRWRDRINPKDFAVEGRRWDDFTDDPTAGDLNDLVLIGHFGMWRPGATASGTDGRLLDVRTGRYRRVPFQGNRVDPGGCFLAGRTSVAITGLGTGGDASFGLYEVNLKTGENRRLGGDLLAIGFTIDPVLSPDGQTLAVLHKGAAERRLDAQVCLVDVKTGAARRLGEPHDLGALSWLPDGRGLIVLVRVPDPTGSRLTDTIARLDLDGTLTTLREGSMPVVLADGRRILFKDPRSKTWRTCSLEGKDEKPYADGLAEYGFPAPAPDGRRLLMMRFQPDKAPVPMILPIDAAQGKPATTAPGLWAMPSWR